MTAPTPAAHRSAYGSAHGTAHSSAHPAGGAAARPPGRWPAWLRRGAPPGRLGWRRSLLLRRLVAAALAVAALVLAVRPAEPGAVVPVLVAAADLPAGARLAPDDLAVRSWPAELAPAGALRELPADGRALVGAARAGEPITDARLAGADRATEPGTAVVPVRLADPGVAAVLAPGSRVDVVAPGERADEVVVLSADATVQAVLDPAAAARAGPDAGERLVLIAMPRAAANRVASVSLSRAVAVTLR
jgi:pilus assembly protein CpaB